MRCCKAWRCLLLGVCLCVAVTVGSVGCTCGTHMTSQRQRAILCSYNGRVQASDCTHTHWGFDISQGSCLLRICLVVLLLLSLCGSSFYWTFGYLGCKGQFQGSTAVHVAVPSKLHQGWSGGRQGRVGGVQGKLGVSQLTSVD